MNQLVKSDAWEKFYDSPLSNFTPDSLRRARAGQESGYLFDTDALFSAMYHEWDALQKDVNTMSGAVSALQWRAVPATDDGDKPSDRAKDVAETVNKALWRGMSQASGTWRHGFLDLVGCLYHALCRGVNVHEIDWAFDGGLWFPRSYLPVSPRHYAWARDAGKPDRLLLFRKDVLDGNGEPFPADRFIVALNNTGPDHPMRNALFVSLVGWFGAAHWGLIWLMRYCQIFGIPFRVFNIRSDEDKSKLQAMLDGGSIIQDVILSDGDSVTIQEASRGASIPQAELISMAEKACHKLILGQTLTSDTSDGGSRAQAEVHNEVQSAEVLAVGNYIAGVLNAQLVPAIVRKNYGRIEGVPMPEIRCSLPGSKASKEKIDLYKGMIVDLGMPLLKSAVYDDLGQAIPGEGDEVLTRPTAPMPGLDSISAAAAVLAEYSKKALPRTL